MSYIKVEASNRNASELRSCIDQISAAYKLLGRIDEKMSQMSSGGTDYTALEIEYNVGGQGADLHAVISSAKGELDGNPFFQQLISRVS